MYNALKLGPNMYQPDNWIILKVVTEDEFYYKVLAGWSGGYLDGDSWRMNSGITKIEISNDYYDFISDSGSIYRCSKKGEIVRMNIAEVLTELLEQFPDTVSVINVDDILSEFTK